MTKVFIAGSRQISRLPAEIRQRIDTMIDKGFQILLLTDDLAARDAARRLAIMPVGSLGVIVRVFRLDRVSLEEAERLLRRLRDDTTLFVTPTIVDLAIEQLRTP